MRPDMLQVRINRLVQEIALPETNDADTQQFLHDFYVYDTLYKMGNGQRKKLADEAKERFILPPIGDRIAIANNRPYTLFAKRSNPRSQFALADFLKKVSAETGKSVSELNAIAKTCYMETAAPIGFTIEAN